MKTVHVISIFDGDGEWWNVMASSTKDGVEEAIEAFKHSYSAEWKRDFPADPEPDFTWWRFEVDEVPLDGTPPV